jgi:hypothetical protein
MTSATAAFSRSELAPENKITYTKFRQIRQSHANCDHPNIILSLVALAAARVWRLRGRSKDIDAGASTVPLQRLK